MSENTTEREDSEIVHGPDFVCQNCGFANVRLTEEGAKCTECRTLYRPYGGEFGAE